MTRKAFSLIEISIAIIIIGILIGGITQAIEMFSEASLKGARNLSKSSRISRIDDLSLWLDATSDKAFDTEKDDKSTISMWKDTNPRSTYPIVGNPVSANLPTYILSAINGLPTASFKKTSSNCMTIPSQSIVNNSEDFTLYLIFSPTSLDDGIILEKNNATATAFPFSLELNGGYYKFSIKDSTTTLSVLGAKKANINKPNLIRLSRTKGSQIEISINGVSSNKSDTLTSSTLNTAELAIGCRNGATPANFINGNIGEIAFFDRNLNDKVKSEIEEYFYKKWKMKKYEGSLVSAELPCTVPSSENTDLSITTVQPTSIPQDILCKSGYSGTPKYTCINGTFNIASGSCTQITSCNVSDCASENYAGKEAVTDINCVNLKSILGNTVNINATGTYITKSNGYYPEGLNGPEYSLRWKCKSDGNMDIDIEKGCIFLTNLHYTNHGVRSTTKYVFNGTIWTQIMGDPVYKYCCSGLLYYDNPCAPWYF
jgi:prepilin-type N-terminal cleavage/methylation domain-containing protein